jgi:RHS repeat-associated protein
MRYFLTWFIFLASAGCFPLHAHISKQDVFSANVSGLVSAADGSVAAKYEYGPFGELIRASGPLAFENPFRFSTKYYDDETDLVYYGYRFYNPATGRWLNRDPLGEHGGLNLYGFVNNNPNSYLDPLGLEIGDNSDPRTWLCRGKGLAQNLWEQGKSLAAASMNPGEALVGAVSSAASAAGDLGGTYDAMKDAANQAINNYANNKYGCGDPCEAAAAEGRLAGEIGTMFIGVGELSKVGKLGKVGELQKASKLGELQKLKFAGNLGKMEGKSVAVFRQGTFADEALGWEGNYVKGRQWATDNPLTTPDYAKNYGLPKENTSKPDWVVGGHTAGAYSTRPAPPSHNNPINTGGATEVLPGDPDNIRLHWFHMPD